jgi:DNA helicase-2/ATP-dependent DNA helicase PcrA
MLNAEQSALAAAPERQIVAIAGAGAGKTATMAALVTTRAMRLETICVLSFTRAAAGEFAERVERALVGHHVAPRVTTFHGLAARFLRQMAERFGRFPNFTIYDEVDNNDLVKMIGRELRLTVTGVDAIMKRPAAQAEYNARMKRGNALCYDDLERLIAKLSEDGGLGEAVGYYDVVIVDEAQDTNSRQLGFVAAMGPRALILVGDPRQSIYSFRGAEPALMVDLLKSAGWARYDLTTNFRSTPEVVAEGNRIADAWPAITAHRPSGPTVERGAGEGQRADTVAILKRWMVEGVEPKDLAVIGRAWRDIEHVYAALVEAGIPARVCRSKNVWDEPDGRALSRLMRVRENKHDCNMSSLVQSYLNAQANDELHQDIHEAESAAAGRGCDVATILFPWLSAVTGNNPAEVARAVAAFIDREAAMEPALAELGLHAWAEGETFLDWWDNRHERRQRDDANEVSCITVHGSKGLEWVGVVVLGAEDPGVFPGKRGLNPTGGLNAEGEESMRCLYVAVTRARDRLAYVRHKPYEQAP